MLQRQVISQLLLGEDMKSISRSLNEWFNKKILDDPDEDVMRTSLLEAYSNGNEDVKVFFQVFSISLEKRKHSFETAKDFRFNRPS